jgi:hypothetical protein
VRYSCGFVGEPGRTTTSATRESRCRSVEYRPVCGRPAECRTGTVYGDRPVTDIPRFVRRISPRYPNRIRRSDGGLTLTRLTGERFDLGGRHSDQLHQAGLRTCGRLCGGRLRRRQSGRARRPHIQRAYAPAWFRTRRRLDRWGHFPLGPLRPVLRPPRGGPAAILTDGPPPPSRRRSF